jgi:TRAP-type C4-dicarboxylate transport system permease large subunit
LTTARDAVLALIMPAIILAACSGVYTPTEGAAVAVAYALVIGVVVYRSLTSP